jgi:hypothetical protein
MNITFFVQDGLPNDTRHEMLSTVFDPSYVCHRLFALQISFVIASFGDEARIVLPLPLLIIDNVLSSCEIEAN